MRYLFVLIASYSGGKFPNKISPKSIRYRILGEDLRWQYLRFANSPSNLSLKEAWNWSLNSSTYSSLLGTSVYPGSRISSVVE